MFSRWSETRVRTLSPSLKVSWDDSNVLYLLLYKDTLILPDSNPGTLFVYFLFARFILSSPVSSL